MWGHFRKPGSMKFYFVYYAYDWSVWETKTDTDIVAGRYLIDGHIDKMVQKEAGLWQVTGADHSSDVYCVSFLL